MFPASSLVGPYHHRIVVGIPASKSRCAHSLRWRAVEWSHGRNYQRRSSALGGYYSPSRAAARRDTAADDEDEEDVENSSSKPRQSLVGSYAASTALAVQESLPPEGVIVLLACIVGVLTGGSVVLFNLAVCPLASSLIAIVRILIDCRLRKSSGVELQVRLPFALELAHASYEHSALIASDGALETSINLTSSVKRFKLFNTNLNMTSNLELPVCGQRHLI